MKHSQAVDICRKLLFACQKFKSITEEELSDLSPRVKTFILNDLNPWINGEKSIVPALGKMIDRAENGGEITGMEFYNVMTIMDRFEPTVKNFMEVQWEFQIPSPDITWAMGWEAE